MFRSVVQKEVTDEVAHGGQGKKEQSFHTASLAGKLLCLSERETSRDRLRHDCPSASEDLYAFI